MTQNTDIHFQVINYQKHVVILYIKILSYVFVYLNSKILTFRNYFILIKYQDRHFKNTQDS